MRRRTVSHIDHTSKQHQRTHRDPHTGMQRPRLRRMRLCNLMHNREARIDRPEAHKRRDHDLLRPKPLIRRRERDELQESVEQTEGAEDDADSGWGQVEPASGDGHGEEDGQDGPVGYLEQSEPAVVHDRDEDRTRDDGFD